MNYKYEQIIETYTGLKRAFDTTNHEILIHRMTNKVP